VIGVVRLPVVKIHAMSKIGVASEPGIESDRRCVGSPSTWSRSERTGSQRTRSPYGALLVTRKVGCIVADSQLFLAKTIKGIGLLIAKLPSLIRRVVFGVESKDTSLVLARCELARSRRMLRLLPMRRRLWPADTVIAMTIGIGRPGRMLPSEAVAREIPADWKLTSSKRTAKIKVRSNIIRSTSVGRLRVQSTSLRTKWTGTTTL